MGFVAARDRKVVRGLLPLSVNVHIHVRNKALAHGP